MSKSIKTKLLVKYNSVNAHQYIIQISPLRQKTPATAALLTLSNTARNVLQLLRKNKTAYRDAFNVFFTPTCYSLH